MAAATAIAATISDRNFTPFTLIARVVNNYSQIRQIHFSPIWAPPSHNHDRYLTDVAGFPIVVLPRFLASSLPRFLASSLPRFLASWFPDSFF
jgi:hypothetical protein